MVIPCYTGRVMRQYNKLSNLKRMDFITGAIKNEKTSASITSTTSSSSLSQHRSSSTESPQTKSSYTAQDSYDSVTFHQQYYAVPNNYTTFYEYGSNYVQPKRYYFPQNFTNSYSRPPQCTTHYYSTIDSSTKYETYPQSTSVMIEKRPSKAATIKKPPSKTTNTVEELDSTVEDEKQRLKMERKRLSEIRQENNAHFKTYLNSLPEIAYPKHYKVECVGSLSEANEKLKQLISEDPHKVYGVDLEWPPCFVKGRPENKISLVQICSGKRILLIQLSRIQGFPAELRKFFEAKNLLKSGVNIGADGLKIQRDFGITTNGLVELRDLAEIADTPKLGLSHLRSLRALTGIFLDQNMIKGKVRISNWARPELSELQIKYAALDAYASYQLYVTLVELRDKAKKMTVRHLIEEPIPKQKQPKKAVHTAEYISSKIPANSSDSYNHKKKNKQHNNFSNPTSTVTIIKKRDGSIDK